MVMNASNLSTQEIEAGGFEVLCHWHSEASLAI